MRWISIAAVLMLFVATGQDAIAWSEVGHKIVGSIGFRQLTPDQQQRIIAILKAHPRYEEDFKEKMPADLSTETDRNEWLFQQAAVWPDMARSFKGDALREFNHPTWHYINLPFFLTNDDRIALEDSLRVNTSMEPPAAEQEEMNIIQTIRLARRLLADSTTADAKKAVMLCWLMHTVGDIHQPLHSTTLLTKHLFPTGDRGGSILKTVQRQNLHFVWDQFPGNKGDFRTARNRATAIVKDAAHAKIGTDAATKLDEETWLSESNELALAMAYDSEVLGYLRGYAGEREAPPLELSQRYLTEGGMIAERRVVESGYRLGAILKQILKP